MKKWGKIKIQRELEGHGLTNRCINIGLKEIDETEYRDTLESLIKKKWQSSEEPNAFKRKDKTARHAILKGYEPDLVWGIIKVLKA